MSEFVFLLTLFLGFLIGVLWWALADMATQLDESLGYIGKLQNEVAHHAGQIEQLKRECADVKTTLHIITNAINENPA